MTIYLFSLFPLLSSFFVECLIFFCLPLLLCLPFVLTSQAPLSSLEPKALKKKHFFLLLRSVQLLLVVCLTLDFFVERPLAFLPNDLFDTVFLHSGNFFFRHDGFVWFVNFFLTGIAFYYSYLIAFVFTRTTTNIAYICEIPFLILCTLLCLRLFLATNDLILIIILLEITAFCSIIYMGLQSVSSPLYSLSIEATIKYFIINAISVSILVFAISGYFYLTLSTNLIDIVNFFYKYPFNCIFFTEQLILVQVLFFFAYLIKLGAAPVHNWVPDVYEGAETLVTCFLVLLIGPALAFKFLVFYKMLLAIPTSIFLVKSLLFMCGSLSVFFGTLGALYQTRIKRFIAYAGLTHLGFMLLGLCFNGFLSYFAFLFYLIIYVLTNICFFTFLVLCQYYKAEPSVHLVFINQLKLYLQTSFFFFFCLVICLFSFAGIPPFAGFFAKFFILSTLIQNEFYFSFFALIIAILIGTFMYLRFLKITLFESSSLLDGQPRHITLQSFFYTFPKTLVAVFADYQLRVKLQTIIYNTTQIDTWQTWLISSLLWLLSFLLLFFFFFSLYSVGIFELSVVLLTIY